MSEVWGLMAQFAAENDFDYDAVILARPDVWFHVDIDLPRQVKNEGRTKDFVKRGLRNILCERVRHRKEDARRHTFLPLRFPSVACEFTANYTILKWEWKR